MAKDYTITFTVEKSPQAVFDSITNVQLWWIDHIEGKASKTGDEFVVRFGDVHYSKQKVEELVKAKKVVWHVTDSKLNFISDQQEWTGTKIIFEISPLKEKTQLRFTHEGLVPGIECYSDCTSAWSDYIKQSLRQLIETGKGTPYRKPIKEKRP